MPSLAARAAALLAAAAFAAAAEQPEPAQLCVSSTGTLDVARAVCRSVDEKRFAPAPETRLYLAVTGGGSAVSVGEVGPDRSPVEVTAGTAVPIRLVTSASRPAADVRIAIRKLPEGAEWAWIVAASDVVRLQTLRLAPGSYELSLESPGHRRLRHALQVPKRGRAEAAVFRLEPLQRISGTVVDRRSKQPVIGSAIVADSGKPLGVTDYGGNFEADVPDDQELGHVTVTAGGFGARTIPLPRTRADIALPPIELGPGGSLHVVVDRQQSPDGELIAEMARRNGNDLLIERRATLKGERNAWEVDDIEAGEYVLLLKGSGPFQRLAREVSIKQGEKTHVALSVEPETLLGLVSRGNKGMAGARVTVRSTKFAWTSAFTTDVAGAFEEELWEPTKLVVTIEGPQLRSPYSTVDEPRTGGRWEIVIPSDTISGVVTENDSGAPIAGATVTLDSEQNDGTKRSLRFTTDEQGAFAFEGVAPGSHTVGSIAESYVAVTPPETFTTTGRAGGRFLRLRMKRGVRQQVLVVGDDGAPAQGALVMDLQQIDPLVQQTDMRGRTEVNVALERGATLLVVPLRGSFAIARIAPAAKATATPIEVRVPRATASLRVMAVEKQTSEPVKNVSVLLRYDGEFLPPIADRIFARLGMPLRTGADGQLFLANVPPGLYELWPYGARAEALEIMRAQHPAAATLGIAAGPYEVRMRFDTGGTPAR